MARTPSMLVLLAVLLATSVVTAARSTRDLTFAENVYVKLSGACRAIMDFRYGSATDGDVAKTIRIVQLSRDVLRSVPVDGAYEALTRPSDYDITRQTKIVIHGFKDSPHSAVPMELARAYADKDMFNVLMVDAEVMLGDWYVSAVHNARIVGKRLANLLANLETYGANAEDFHLLGISLGAHVAGWTGKYFRRYRGRSLGRITGLDPAGPCFSHAVDEQRLDKSDAQHVDVVHSNRLVQGVLEPLGHADFYINGGGPMQPGCTMPSCSHLRAARVYAESVRRPKSLVGVRCRSWRRFEENACESNQFAVLGYGSSNNARGRYYLRTAASSPFGLGMNGTRMVRSSMDNWLKNLHIT